MTDVQKQLTRLARKSAAAILLVAEELTAFEEANEALLPFSDRVNIIVAAEKLTEAYAILTKEGDKT